MNTTHDDLPHPVPPMAYLRWKENWFFNILDERRGVSGIAHFNYEPAMNRARFSCNLWVRGTIYKYANQTPFPEGFALSRDLGDERLRVRIEESEQHFTLRLDTQDVLLEVDYRKLSPTYDFMASEAANPFDPGAKELFTCAMNLPYNHAQQALTFSGTLILRKGTAEEVIPLAGIGYRDHSLGMRFDNLLRGHIWSWYVFGDRVFSVLQLRGLFGPQVLVRQGFVSDTRGTRALRDIDIVAGEANSELHPGANWYPRETTYKLRDVYGESFTLRVDLENALGIVPLVGESTGTVQFRYEIAEVFCRAQLLEANQSGAGLYETGRQIGTISKRGS